MDQLTSACERHSNRSVLMQYPGNVWFPKDWSLTDEQEATESQCTIL
jgi:hypothetical protein